jgi:S1-C subfamily serine protease
MIKKVLRLITIFILGIGGGIFGAQIFWPYFIERPLFYQYQLEKNPIYLTEKKEITIQENTALKEAIEKVEKVVIGLKTKTKKGKRLEGSALILTSDGLILTLSNLIPPDSRVNFIIDNEIFPGQILKRDQKENLVLAKIEKKNLKSGGFFDFEKLKLGERVFLIGTIFKEGKIKKVVNEGVVKYFDKEIIETSILEKNDLSGSILFDIEGNILGINKIDSQGRVISIPVSKIRSFSGL